MYRVLATLSIPIVLNSLIQTLYNLADGLWVSRLPPSTLQPRPLSGL